MEGKIYPRLDEDSEDNTSEIELPMKLNLEPSAPLNEYSEMITPTTTTTTDHFRLQKINEIEQNLQKNSDSRKKLIKKYNRAHNIVSSTDSILTTACMGLGASGIVLLTTVISAPIVILLESVSLGTGLLSIVAKGVGKKLQTKADKHLKIYVLAETKLNTIHSHISKALEDGRVSQEEFSLILEEEKKFIIMKEEIKRANKKQVSEYEKNSFINKGKEEMITKFIRFFKKEIK